MGGDVLRPRRGAEIGTAAEREDQLVLQREELRDRNVRGSPLALAGAEIKKLIRCERRFNHEEQSDGRLVGLVLWRCRTVPRHVPGEESLARRPCNPLAARRNREGLHRSAVAIPGPQEQRSRLISEKRLQQQLGRRRHYRPGHPRCGSLVPRLGADPPLTSLSVFVTSEKRVPIRAEHARCRGRW